MILEIGRILSGLNGVELTFLLCSPGPMIDDYRTLGAVHVLDATRTGLTDLLGSLVAAGHSGAITNATPSGVVVPALKSCGFVVTSLVHELPNLLKSYGLEAAARSIAQLSDHIVFPADVVRRGFEEFAGSVTGDIEVRSQGLWNTEVLATPRGDDGLRAELGLPEGCKIVLGVGYADLRKGIDRFFATAMSVCSHRDDVIFLWVGPPADETLHWFLPEVAAAGLGERIRMVGYTEHLARYYALADIFYLASREDPFPSVVLEALSAGLPIVGHRGTGGCDDLIARHGLLLSETDPQSASSAVVQLLDDQDPTRLRAAQAARRAEVADNYRFDDYAFDLLRRLDPDLVGVSAVIPNYNYQAYIGERLRSVFDQSYPLREVVVLDDASPDDSLTVISATAAAAKRSIKLHVNARNSGSPFPQWRKGVELARGDYVWIAEADDLATPDFVMRLVDRMRRAGSVLGFTDSAQIDETGANVSLSYRPYVNQIEPGAFDLAFDMDGPTFLARYLAVKNVILNVSGVIFRRDALLDAFAAVGDALSDYSVAGDWRLYADLCSRSGSRISYLPDALNIHRRHQASVTHALQMEKHLNEIETMHRLIRKMVRISPEVHIAQRKTLTAARAHLKSLQGRKL